MEELLKQGEKEFEEKFIIPKGHFRQEGWENVEGKHIWGKFSQDGGKEILVWHNSQIKLAYEKGREDGREEGKSFIEDLLE